MLIDEVREFLARYFEVLQTQDMALFDAVFHPSCVLYSQQDGALVVRPFAVYRDVVLGRQPHLDRCHRRRQKVEE
jgi:hypothetical protein